MQNKVMIKLSAVVGLAVALTACMHAQDGMPTQNSTHTQDQGHTTQPVNQAAQQSNQINYVQAIEQKNQAVAKALGIQRLSQANIDLQMGLIFFKVAQNSQAYEMDVIGSYDPQTKTLQWAWENPDLDPDLKITATQLKAYGAQHQIAALNTPNLNCTEQQAWQYTAMAAHLAGADGAYSAMLKGKRVFVVFKTQID